MATPPKQQTPPTYLPSCRIELFGAEGAHAADHQGIWNPSELLVTRLESQEIMELLVCLLQLPLHLFQGRLRFLRHLGNFVGKGGLGLVREDNAKNFLTGKKERKNKRSNTRRTVVSLS